MREKSQVLFDFFLFVTVNILFYGSKDVFVVFVCNSDIASNIYTANYLNNHNYVTIGNVHRFCVRIKYYMKNM